MPGNNGTATLTEVKIQNQCTNVTYPQVTGLKNKAVESHINDLIKKTVLGLIPPEGCDVYAEIFGNYQVASTATAYSASSLTSIPSENRPPTASTCKNR